MSEINSRELKKFYHGDVNENERTLVEEYLFVSEVGLMEYFAIKRDEEVNLAFLKRPSSEIREKLLSSFDRQEIKLSPIRFKSRRKWLATACGLALIGGFYFWQTEQIESPEMTQDTFQTTVETALDLSAESNFL